MLIKKDNNIAGIKRGNFRHKINDKSQQIIDDFFANGGYDFLRKIENDFKCAGLCNVPLFYITKDISIGRPTKECIAEAFE